MKLQGGKMIIKVNARRVKALEKARERAQDPDFKLLWDSKLRELVAKAAREGDQNESIH